MWHDLYFLPFAVYHKPIDHIIYLCSEANVDFPLILVYSFLVCAIWMGAAAFLTLLIRSDEFFLWKDSVLCLPQLEYVLFHRLVRIEDQVFVALALKELKELIVIQHAYSHA